MISAIRPTWLFISLDILYNKVISNDRKGICFNLIKNNQKCRHHYDIRNLFFYLNFHQLFSLSTNNTNQTLRLNHHTFSLTSQSLDFFNFLLQVNHHITRLLLKGSIFTSNHYPVTYLLNIIIRSYHLIWKSITNSMKNIKTLKEFYMHEFYPQNYSIHVLPDAPPNLHDYPKPLKT